MCVQSTMVEGTSIMHIQPKVGCSHTLPLSSIKQYKVLLFSTYSLQVFNFANFELFTQLIQLKFEPLGHTHV